MSIYNADVTYDHQVEIDTSLYSLDVTLRASYRLTDRFYLFLSRPNENSLSVRISPKASTPTSSDPVGELSNALIDEAVRERIRVETRQVRETIIRCALAEAIDNG